MRLVKVYFLIFGLIILSVNGYSQIDCENETVYNGEGTYYFIEEFGNFGNCSIENEEFNPFLIGAMNASQYGQADYCGACALVTGPSGSVKIHIIDQCPECAHGDIDLSPEAFDNIAPRIDGRVDISWKVMPCETTGAVQFYFKDGSNEWWNAVQIRNHKNRLAKVEYWNGNQYVNMPRQDYNYFLDDSGLGAGPFQFRLTDVYGNEIIETDVPFTITTELNGQHQFPDCGAVGTNNEIEKKRSYIIRENRVSFLTDEHQYEILDVKGKLIASGDTGFGQIKLSSGFFILKISDSISIDSQKIYIP